MNCKMSSNEESIIDDKQYKLPRVNGKSDSIGKSRKKYSVVECNYLTRSRFCVAVFGITTR